MMRMLFNILLSSLILTTRALELDVSDKESICDAANLVVDGMMDYYDGFNYGGVVGMFQPPYYWWQAGHAFGGVLDHWYYCKNATYEQVLLDSLVAQTGDNYDYIPQNQSTTEGNDDQGFWGLLVMGAAERNFTKSNDSDVPDWLALAQAVYNTMWARWDTEHCGGGLRWQIFTWNSGYDYKNTVSTACLFHMAGRLARYTQNETYVDVADEVYTWLVDALFVIEGEKTRVYDGAEITDNCSDVVKLEWTYNYGLLLGGAAYLYNMTESDLWLERVTQLVNGATVFFKDGTVMYERACQDGDTCNNDQRSFKAIFSRTLGLTSILVPPLYDTIRPLLESSAKAAAQSCSGGTDGHTCGLDWTHDGWDSYYGLGEQMSALEVFLSLLPPTAEAPVTNEDENVSTGDYSAGMGSDSTSLDHHPLTIETKDKAGAAIITAIVLVVAVLGAIWMII